MALYPRGNNGGGEPMRERSQIFVGGRVVESGAKGRIDVISPNTEQVFARVPDATPADVDRAVAAAREAFDHGPFPRWSPEERAGAIARLSQALQKRGQAFADLISSQNGCPKQQSLGVQALSATMVLNVYAEIAKSYTWEERRTGALGQPVTVRRAPVGVAACILPWNVPLSIAAMTLGPVVAAGCTVGRQPAPRCAVH